jgi:serine O-acetyltransferase
VHRLLSPLLVAYALTDRRAVIDADVRRWRDVLGGKRGLLELLRLPEFRTLFYHRLRHGNRPGHWLGRMFSQMFRGQTALYLHTREIGEGLFIQHGFATIVAAERIGTNCWINQQVTIGFNDRQERPVLEDYVEVYAGAKILGGVRVGAASRIGANAVVIHDVPSGVTATGVPATVDRAAWPDEPPPGQA